MNFYSSIVHIQFISKNKISVPAIVWDTLACVYSFLNVCHSILYKVSLLNIEYCIYLTIHVYSLIGAREYHERQQFAFRDTTLNSLWPEIPCLNVPTSLLQKMGFWFTRIHQWLHVHVYIEDRTTMLGWWIIGLRPNIHILTVGGFIYYFCSVTFSLYVYKDKTRTQFSIYSL